MYLTTVARTTLLAAVAWGAFAFGAVYPWAYWPLIGMAVATAAGGLLAPSPLRSRALDLNGLTLALVVFLAACAVQLLPLPLVLVQALSPATQPILTELEPAVRLQMTSVHPLSISPAHTLTSLAILAAFSLLLIGTARLFSIVGPVAVATGIAVIGVALALVGIVQKPIYAGEIYGFWPPVQDGANPFGPFVNRNHFAGWMLMALPLTLGLLFGAISRSRRGSTRDLRDTVLWFSSPDANTLMLLAGAVAIMSLSLVLTTSRSGIAAAAVAVVIMMLTLRRSQIRGGRVAATVTVFAMLALVVALAGTDAAASRFATSVGGAGGRLGIWGDALRVAGLYPLAGTGLNTYDIAMLFHQRFNPSLSYSQAHNDYLQLAAEGGLLLAVPALACVIVFVVAVRRRFSAETSISARWIRTGAVIGLVSIALQEVVEFSLQMPGNAFLFVVLCGIALHQPQRRGNSWTSRT